MTDHSKIDKAIVDLGLTMTATFVPCSQSRNAGERDGLRNINWQITIRRTGSTQFITTDYSYGLGSLPKGILPKEYTPGCRITIYLDEAIKGVVETGRGSFLKKVPEPLIRDVLYSLVSDASAIDYPTYEEWAPDLGFDIDSRKGEKIYEICKDIGLRLRAMLGDENVTKLREVFQDY